MQAVEIGEIRVGRGEPLLLIAGPCVIETADHALHMAESLAALTRRVGLPFIFKSSFDKANRTSIQGFRGLGCEEGLRILERVRQEVGVPVLTDVHTVAQARAAGEVVDVIQVPAFLSRQTDLLLAAGRTGKPVNIKKGQFLAPWDMKHAAAKVLSTGNRRVLLTERGSSFGYNTLVVDMRALRIMAGLGYPVIFDATHSVQIPGGRGGASGGDRRFVAPLARAAVACGCQGVFLEIHDDPDRAPCDGPNMFPLAHAEALLADLKAFHELALAAFDLPENGGGAGDAPAARCTVNGDGPC
jgi:2-dehydro-3-deoxyphosphooctonate aldolase (KDO 8-P synthase)